MKAPAAFAVAAAALCTASLASAHAPTAAVRHCRVMPGLIPGYQGGAFDLRIRMRAEMVDHYMPRCKVATFVFGTATRARNDRSIYVGGAGWVVGRYSCATSGVRQVRRDEVRVTTRCIHRGRYANTVWFDSYG